MNDNIFGSPKNPFKVPDNYFDSFEVRIPKKETFLQQQKEGPGTLMAIFKPWMAMAAGILLVALVYAQIPRWFPSNSLSAREAIQNQDSILNSLALRIDEANLTEWISEEKSALIPPMDSLWPASISEEELALLTLFE